MDNISMILEEVHQKLRKGFPFLDFIYILMPMPKEQMQHLGQHEREELEKRVVAAASREFKTCIVDLEGKRHARPA
jgi:hypothetical protein